MKKDIFLDAADRGFFGGIPKPVKKKAINKLMRHAGIKVPKKKITVSKMKKKAWAEFSKYIRLKYSNSSGFIQCYTCRTVKHWKQMQAGHGIGGRNNAVLFMEAVVRPQCVGCNMFGGGKYSVFTENLINEYGAVKYAEFVRESNKEKKMTVLDYQVLFESYRYLSKQLLEEKL